MHLAADYVHPTPGRGRCRVRVFMTSDPERDLFVVVCSELPNNRGERVTNAAERIASEVIDAFKRILRGVQVWDSDRPTRRIIVEPKREELPRTGLTARR